MDGKPRNTLTVIVGSPRPHAGTNEPDGSEQQSPALRQGNDQSMFCQAMIIRRVMGQISPLEDRPEVNPRHQTGLKHPQPSPRFSLVEGSMIPVWIPGLLVSVLLFRTRFFHFLTIRSRFEVDFIPNSRHRLPHPIFSPELRGRKGPPEAIRCPMTTITPTTHPHARAAAAQRAMVNGLRLRPVHGWAVESWNAIRSGSLWLPCARDRRRLHAREPGSGGRYIAIGGARCRGA